MKISVDKSIDTGYIAYTIIFSGHEISRAIFTNADRILFRDCEKSNLVSDKLLALEAIARSIDNENN